MANNNNNLRANVYTQEYWGALETVFGVDKAFANALQALQIRDGVKHNEKAFSVKTNNTPVVIGTYNKGANVAFGTGTGSTNRFGNRTEIIYTDEDVKYDYELAIHEGLDITTVNAGLDEAILDRLYLQAEAQTRDMNERIGKFIADVAGNEEEVAGLGADIVLKLFNDLAAYYTNKEVIVPVTAYVRPDLYNAIVDHPLVNVGKGSAVNIDENGILRFKDFKIKETPERYFLKQKATSGVDAEENVAYFLPDEILIPFVGIEIARAIESEDFAGVALQALAKGGTFVLDDNKVAITKVVLVDEEVSG